jgi:hypothetical protein
LKLHGLLSDNHNPSLGNHLRLPKPIAAWLKLLDELIPGFVKFESAAKQLNPTILLNDNKAAILNASEGRLTAKNRHNARKISILRNELELGNVTYLHIPTHRNHANNGTKPANKSDFFRDKWAYMSTAVDFNDRNDSEDTNIMESKPDEDS